MLRIAPDGHGYFVNQNSGEETSIKHDKVRDYGIFHWQAVVTLPQYHTRMNYNCRDREAAFEPHTNQHQKKTWQVRARKNINSFRTNSEELANLIANLALILGTVGFALVAIGVLKHLRII